MRMFRLWCMALCLVFAGASFASAHRVNIFAFVDGDAVQVECGFNRSQKVKQGTVEVFDATTGARLLQGTTDDNGVFRFPVTAELREASRQAGLFTWDKPAYACLATRIPAGTALDAETLAHVERAEDALRGMGFSDLRVRVFAGAARIQLPEAQLPAAVARREEILEALKDDFSPILLDLKAR